VTTSITAPKRRKSASLKVSRRRSPWGQHGRDNIGIVDLTTSKGIAAAQFDELIPYRRTVLEDGNAPRECDGVYSSLGESQRFSPDLLARHHGHIFTEDLPAERENLVGGKPGESGPSLVTERRASRRRVDEDVGIDEAHRPSSS
jgi:hypothetical protein